MSSPRWLENVAQWTNETADGGRRTKWRQSTLAPAITLSISNPARLFERDSGTIPATFLLTCFCDLAPAKQVVGLRQSIHQREPDCCYIGDADHRQYALANQSDSLRDELLNSHIS
jgi:hypothetical protein